MKVTIDMDNLEHVLEKVLGENIEKVVREEAEKILQSTISNCAKDVIDNIANKSIETYVNDYVKTATLKTGGGLYPREEQKVYTVEQYLRKELAEILDSKTLTITKRNYISDCFEKKKVTFEEFIKESFNFDEIIKKKLNEFSKELKIEITEILNNNLNQTAKNALSETVFKVLTESDVYKKLTDNLKYISEK